MKKLFFILLLMSCLLTTLGAQNRNPVTGLPAEAVTIGTGVARVYAPYDPFYAFTYTQTIYLANELGNNPGLITRIYYQYQSTVEQQRGKQIEVYMVHTTQSSLTTTTAIPVNTLTQVYKGSLYIPSLSSTSPTWIEIILDTPFEYNGTSNLVIGFNQTHPAYNGGSADRFLGTATTNRSIYVQNDGNGPYVLTGPTLGIAFDTTTPNWTLASGGFPNTSFIIEPIQPIFVSPTEVKMIHYNRQNQIITITNFSASTQTITTPTITGANANEFVLNIPSTFSTTIPAGLSTSFDVSFNPSSTGQKNATINVGTQQILITAEGFAPTQMETFETMPFTLNFNHTLPPGWSYYNFGGGNSDLVEISNVTPLNTGSTRYLRLNNGSQAGAIFTVSTPYQQTLDGKRVKVIIRGVNTTTSVIVGVMSNPKEPSTFTPLQTITFGNTNYNEYIVPLGAGVGFGNFIAFRNGTGTAIGQTISIDRMSIEDLPVGADFSCSATNINFGAIPVNSTSQQIISVSNSGSSPLILSQINVNLTGLNYTPLAPITIQGGNTEQFIFTFAPTEGNGIVNGTIIMHTNDFNNQTYTITATAEILPEGLLELGNGTTNLYLPVNTLYGYSHNQQIFHANDPPIAPTWGLGGMSGMIISLSFYLMEANQNYATNASWTIYMGTRSTPTFANTTDWTPLSGLTQVFRGTIPFPDPSTIGWHEIVLDTPFVYAGGTEHLVISINEWAPSYNSSATFASTGTSGGNRSMNVQNDGSAYVPEGPTTIGAGTNRAGFSNIRFQFAGISDDPQINISPNSISFGTINLPLSSNPISVQVRNIGGGIGSFVSATLSGVNANEFTINHGTNTYPIALGSMDLATVQVTFTPSSHGPKVASLIINYNDGAPGSMTIPITGAGHDSVVPANLFHETFTNANPWPPLDWVQLIGNIDLLPTTQPGTTGSTYTTWQHFPNFAGIAGHPNGGTARTNNYSNNIRWFISPIIDLGPTPGAYQLAFDAAVTAYSGGSGPVTNPVTGADKTFAVLAKPVGVDWDPSHILQRWTSDNSDPNPSYFGISHEGEDIRFTLSGMSGLVQFAFYAGCVTTAADNFIYLDNIRTVPAPTGPVFLCTTTNLNFGSIVVNSTGQRSITVTNNGISPLEISSILSTLETISFEPDVPITIAAGNSQIITFTFAPTSGSGDITGSIVLSTNDPNTPTHTITISANVLGEGTVIIGSGTAINIGGTTNNYLPIAMYYYNAYSQQIYLQSEIGSTPGSIVSIAFYYNGLNFTNIDYHREWDIYIGHTNETEFITWIYNIPENMVLHFSGFIPPFPINPEGDWHNITLDTPFEYNGTDNLVVTIHKKRQNSTSFNSLAGHFMTESPGQNRGICYGVDPGTIDPLNPEEATFTEGFPNIKFEMELPPTYNPPQALTATNGVGFVTLNWESPNMTGVDATLNGYKIYKNEIIVNTLTLPQGTTYTDQAIAPSIEYEYYVTALYTNPDVESVPSNSIFVNLVAFPPTNLSATVNDVNVTLTWSAPEISRQRAMLGYHVFRNELQITISPLLNLIYNDRDLEEGIYEYAVTAVYTGNVQSEAITASVTIEATSEQEIIVPPLETLLGRNYPNPFNPSTTIEFSLKNDSFVTLEIYNVKGQKVTTLLNNTIKSGNHIVQWNGIDDYGKTVGSGIYFYMFKADNYSAVKKMVLMK